MMNCPHCGFEQVESTECIRCGIVYRKYARGRKQHTQAVPYEKTSPIHWANLLMIWIKIVLPLSIVAWTASLHYKNQLPSPDLISDLLLTEPYQKAVSVPPFEVVKRKIAYRIKPLFEYELYGLVVSEFRAGSWSDIYHYRRWKDFINVKDLCVIWGDNLRSNAFRQMRFDSSTWTCNYYWPDGETRRRFCPNCLSNNHLLSADPELTKRLLKTQTGDQIYLRGYLAEYSHAGGFNRGTSITREDTGNGACETIFLESFQILKTGQTVWRIVNRVSGLTILGCLILGLVSLLFRPPIIYRKKNRGHTP